MSRETRIKDVKRVLSDRVEDPEKYFVRISTEACIPRNRDAILMYADEPCVEACQRLYDLNIETVNSGANLVEVEHFGDNDKAFIGINYNSLDEKNKIIADNQKQYDYRNFQNGRYCSDYHTDDSVRRRFLFFECGCGHDFLLLLRHGDGDCGSFFTSLWNSVLLPVLPVSSDRLHY